MQETILPVELTKQHEFYDLTFTDLKVDGLELLNKTFENCIFINSSFSAAKLTNCKFIDCTFKTCNLSSIKLSGTAFVDVLFAESKVIGVNWTEAKWPYIKLVSPIKFYQSNISYASFYTLDLREISIQECKAHEVDFREANLNNASFILTDLHRSLFMHTKLEGADFSDAINYNIHPTENNIKKAKFSLPEAISLLDGFNIEINN